MDIDTQTRLVGLLGYPVAHSLSPRMHNAAFQAQGLNHRYVALPVAPGDLPTAVAGLRVLPFDGANVTIPHKQAVRPLVDTLSDRAEAVGAVNTLVLRRDEDGGPAHLYGDNTDVEGFLAPLEPLAERLREAPMLIFGAGGAARAVVYALLTHLAPERVTLAVRTPARAEALAADLAAYDPHGALHVVPLAEAAEAVRASRLLVNATPLGTHPHTEGTPWPEATDLHEEQVAYDLVYNPSRTRWLRDAEGQGAHTIGGLEMLIAQAAAAYVQWTDVPMPLDAVRATLTVL